MRTRPVLALSLASLALAATAFAADNEQKPTPVNVAAVKNVDVVAENGASLSFALVNPNGTCYAIRTTGDSAIAAGQVLQLLPSSDIDENVRAKLVADYPQCKVMYVTEPEDAD